MRFYYVPKSYDAQIEGSALLGIRIGYTGVGIATRKFQRPQSKVRWHDRFFPLFWLAINNHSGQNDMRYRVRIRICGHGLDWLVAGKLTNKSLDSANSIGLSWR